MSEKIRVLLADDTLIAREGWKKILETEEDIAVVGEAATAQEIPGKVRELQPDVLLVDLRWFDDDTAGRTAIAQIKREALVTKVIAITAYPNLIAGARRAGAEAALPKGFSRLELVSLIRTVYQMPGFTPPQDETIGSDQLSERELEVLELMALGMKDRGIANNLGIAPSTARNHVGNVISKLGAANRAHAVAIGYDRGLLKRGDA